ncbi:MAG: hypothetical protein AAF437_07575 [Pseudomonadota bacterium]
MVIKAGLVMAALATLSASGFANTVQKVRFVQPAQVLVWQDGALIGQGESVNVNGAATLSPGPFLGSGQLDPLNVFTPNATGKLRLRIASNTSFFVATTDPQSATQIQARVIAVGANAKAAPQASDARRGIVYLQSEKTALRRGAPDSQAIEIELSWTGAAPHDLRVIAASP